MKIKKTTKATTTTATELRLRKTLATAMRRKEGQFVIGADHCVCVCECVGEIKM